MMNKLVRPLAYIVGLGIFCGCISTRTISTADLSPTGKERTAVLVLIDGGQITIHSVVVAGTEILGETPRESSLTAKRYLIENPETTFQPRLRVAVPLSEVVEIRVEHSGRMGLPLFLLAGVGLVVILGLVSYPS